MKHSKQQEHMKECPSLVCFAYNTSTSTEDFGFVMFCVSLKIKTAQIIDCSINLYFKRRKGTEPIKDNLCIDIGLIFLSRLLADKGKVKK